MKKNKVILHMYLLSILFVCSACVEELDFKTSAMDEGKGLLVVEATLTDQYKRQQVFISRSDTRFDLETDTVYSYVYPLGIGNRDSVLDEQNARVTVVSENGVSYNFFEDEPGIYLSQQPFALQLNEEYSLKIETSGGSRYTSEPISIKSSAEIINVNIERTFNKSGIEGVQISVDGEPRVGDPNLYRYTYEETFKIIAPKWNLFDFKLSNYDPCALPEVIYDLEIIEREIENRICYQTVPSNTVIQNNLINNQGAIVAFPVRFIDRDNFIISHRYSIIVSQYVQSLEAYNFYNILKRFSESESVFSQVQTGALLANVKRIDNKNEPVLGYVEASSVSEQRIYFDYEDLFTGEDLPTFPYNCNDTSAPESHISYCLLDPSAFDPCPPSIIENVNVGLITYTGLNGDNLGTCPGPYLFVPRVCGDCLILGENTPPEWWEE